MCLYLISCIVYNIYSDYSCWSYMGKIAKEDSFPQQINLKSRDCTTWVRKIKLHNCKLIHYALLSRNYIILRIILIYLHMITMLLFSYSYLLLLNIYFPIYY